MSALKEESKIKAQEVEAYKQVVIQKNEEIDQLLAQLQQLEEEGQVMQEERTLQHSVQQLQFEQQVHQLTVDSSKLRMKLAQVEDEKADAVRQLEFAQNTKEFQDSCVTDSISKLEVAIYGSAEAFWFDVNVVATLEDVCIGCFVPENWAGTRLANIL